ncbi:MAG: hypothetical protein EAZ99_03265 [Alphaproteobacteria bacterium]|nr:MAG: hypothetical protein EAZ99_03265 [Alphaproteobacteria bacterium]
MATVLGFITDSISLPDTVCKLAPADTRWADMCGAGGWGDHPTRAAREDFAALPPGNCAALSAFRAKHEDSPLRRLADSRLTDRRAVEAWSSASLSLPLVQPTTAQPASTEQAARAATRLAAEEQAQSLCSTHNASGLFRVRQVALTGEGWECQSAAAAYTCSLAAEAHCSGEQRVTTDICGSSP